MIFILIFRWRTYSLKYLNMFSFNEDNFWILLSAARSCWWCLSVRRSLSPPCSWPLLIRCGCRSHTAGVPGGALGWERVGSRSLQLPLPAPGCILRKMFPGRWNLEKWGIIGCPRMAEFSGNSLITTRFFPHDRLSSAKETWEYLREAF